MLAGVIYGWERGRLDWPISTAPAVEPAMMDRRTVVLGVEGFESSFAAAEAIVTG
jgi:hypothetical protein